MINTKLVIKSESVLFILYIFMLNYNNDKLCVT